MAEEVGGEDEKKDAKRELKEETGGREEQQRRGEEAREEAKQAERGVWTKMKELLMMIVNLSTILFLLLAVFSSGLDSEKSARAGQTMLRALTLFCMSLKAGSALYESVVKHPARMKMSPDVAIRLFTRTYQRLGRMHSMLATTATIATMFAYSSPGGDIATLLSGLLNLTALIFSVLIVIPIELRLLDPQRDSDMEETRRLLIERGRLHNMRTIVVLISALLILHSAFEDSLRFNAHRPKFHDIGSHTLSSLST